jgi:hypothetical protein
LVPSRGFFDVDHLRDGSGGSGRNSPMLDCHGQSVDRRTQEVTQRRRRLLGAQEGALESLQVTGDELVAGRQVGGRDDGVISSSGMSRVRNRRMTWAVGIWEVP